jgi:hypothetical protein
MEMEDPRSRSRLGRLVTGVLIAFFGAYSYDLLKTHYPSLGSNIELLIPFLKRVSDPPQTPSGERPPAPVAAPSGSSVPPPEPVVFVPPEPVQPAPPNRAPGGRVVVPELVGKDVETAFRILEGLGLQALRSDGADRHAAGWVTAQWPEGQRLAEVGAIVSLDVGFREGDAMPVQGPPTQGVPPPDFPAPVTAIAPAGSSFHDREWVVLNPNPKRPSRPAVPEPRPEIVNIPSPDLQEERKKPRPTEPGPAPNLPTKPGPVPNPPARPGPGPNLPTKPGVPPPAIPAKPPVPRPEDPNKGGSSGPKAPKPPLPRARELRPPA